MDLQKEAQERDKAIENLKQFRADIIVEAKKIALILAKKNGTVTSPQVVEQLQQNIPAMNILPDKRFMGAVFREDIWERVGFSNTGSHCQPISVWRLKHGYNG